LKGFPDESGIVYTFTRKQTESLSAYLQTQGIKAKAYHAGLPVAQRQEAFHQFVHDEIQVVVATIAFGMGIDKSNIRFVVHMTLPKTIENFYQEIGRAGRDGLEAQTLLLYSVGDLIQRRELIEQLPDSPYKVHSHDQLERMILFAGGEDCRHKDVADYFGDKIDPCIDHCDNCLHPHHDKVNITTKAQMLLSAVYRTGQRFGQAYIIDILRGSEHQKIRDNGHALLKVHGIGKEESRGYWEQIAERLMETGALGRGEYRALVITESGKSILTGKQSIDIRQARLEIKERHEPIKTRQSIDNPEDFEALRKLRSEISKEEGKPAYVIFNDKSLIDMSVRLPQDKAAMLEISGVGEVKYERYGERFLALCQELGSQSASLK